MTGMTDWDLLNLYREFSEDTYAAGFMSSPEREEGKFANWLVGALAIRKRQIRYGSQIMEDYEREGLPVFRRAYERALAASPPDHALDCTSDDCQATTDDEQIVIELRSRSGAVYARGLAHWPCLEGAGRSLLAMKKSYDKNADAWVHRSDEEEEK